MKDVGKSNRHTKNKHGCSSRCGNACQTGGHDKETIERFASALKKVKSKKPQKSPLPSSECLTYLCTHNIIKRTLHSGHGLVPPQCQAAGGGIAYPKDTKFIFHYRILDPDDRERVMDDSRSYGQTMELYSGKQFQIEFWEYCLGTMVAGEVAAFTVPEMCLANFPMVNKKLRDYMLKKTGPGSAGGIPKHCCGLLGLQEQGGLGYADLDDLMRSPKILEFTFELISFVLAEEVRKDSWIMTAEEKAELIPGLRREGNSRYAAGQWLEAAAKYEEGLGLLEQLCLREKPGDPEYRQLDASRLPFFLNLAQCQSKLKDFYGAINSANEALSRDPDNVKALYRRAKCYAETFDLDLSEKDLNRLLLLAPNMRNDIMKELSLIQKTKQDVKLEERRRLAGKLLTSPRDV